MRSLLTSLPLWLLLCWPALAFEPLSGAQIRGILSDRTLIYPGGITQDFRASGRTLHRAGQESWGVWDVRGDEYCSQWPPGEDWACYGVARKGMDIRFAGADGGISIGTLRE